MEADVIEDGTGRLYVVSTPIGNMGDFSFRAVEILRKVALVLAEDTRHTRNLLDRYEIRTPMAPYHEHNEARATPGLIARMRRGEELALVSDAGTPLVSDPGARLVEAAVEAGIDVIPVPGASALLAALVVSGLDATRFTFHGFLPRKGKERADVIGELARSTHTTVLYEAPARVSATLADLVAAGAGERRATVAREMTKQFEEVRRGTVAELQTYYDAHPPRGEVVIVIGGGTTQAPGEEQVRERARALRAEGLSARDVAARLASELGVPRNAAYRMAQEEGER